MDAAGHGAQRAVADAGGGEGVAELRPVRAVQRQKLDARAAGGGQFGGAGQSRSQAVSASSARRGSSFFIRLGFHVFELLCISEKQPAALRRYRRT